MGEESLYLEWHLQDSRGEPLLNLNGSFLASLTNTQDLRIILFTMYVNR